MTTYPLAAPAAHQMPPPNPTAIVSPPVIHHGIVNASHTSSVALVYLNSTMPTPWPFYLASMGLSLLTVSMALLIAVVRSARRRRNSSAPSPMRSAPKAIAALSESARRRLRHVVLHIPLLITTARTAGTLSLAVRFVRQHGGARRPALSNIAALIFSVVPNANGCHSHLALGLAAVEIVLLFASAFMVGIVRDSSNPAVWYGDLAATGGAGGCPLTVAAEELHASYVGCGLNSVGGYANGFDGGPVGGAESVPHMVIGWLYACILLPALFACLAELIVAIDYLLSFCGRRRRYPFSRPGSNRNNRLNNFGRDDITLTDVANGGDGAAAGSPSGSRRQHKDDNTLGWLDDAGTAFMCCCALVLITLYTVVIFPVHYVHQTRHRTISVFDSFGPLVRAGDMFPAGALSGTSWSDWFRVAQPADRFGYMAVWWREHGKRWDTLLAFL